MLITLYGGWTDLVRPVAVGRATCFPYYHLDPPACRQSELVASHNLADHPSPRSRQKGLADVIEGGRE